jgi:hypothetical protein
MAELGELIWDGGAYRVQGGTLDKVTLKGTSTMGGEDPNGFGNIEGWAVKYKDGTSVFIPTQIAQPGSEVVQFNIELTGKDHGGIASAAPSLLPNSTVLDPGALEINKQYKMIEQNGRNVVLKDDGTVVKTQEGVGIISTNSELNYNNEELGTIARTQVGGPLLARKEDQRGQTINDKDRNDSVSIIFDTTQGHFNSVVNTNDIITKTAKGEIPDVIVKKGTVEKDFVQTDHVKKEGPSQIGSLPTPEPRTLVVGADGKPIEQNGLPLVEMTGGNRFRGSKGTDGTQFNLRVDSVPTDHNQAESLRLNGFDVNVKLPSGSSQLPGITALATTTFGDPIVKPAIDPTTGQAATDASGKPIFTTLSTGTRTNVFTVGAGVTTGENHDLTVRTPMQSSTPIQSSTPVSTPYSTSQQFNVNTTSESRTDVSTLNGVETGRNTVSTPPVRMETPLGAPTTTFGETKVTGPTTVTQTGPTTVKQTGASQITDSTSMRIDPIFHANWTNTDEYGAGQTKGTDNITRYGVDAAATTKSYKVEGFGEIARNGGSGTSLGTGVAVGARGNSGEATDLYAKAYVFLDSTGRNSNDTRPSIATSSEEFIAMQKDAPKKHQESLVANIATIEKLGVEPVLNMLNERAKDMEGGRAFVDGVKALKESNSLTPEALAKLAETHLGDSLTNITKVTNAKEAAKAAVPTSPTLSPSAAHVPNVQPTHGTSVER